MILLFLLAHCIHCHCQVLHQKVSASESSSDSGNDDEPDTYFWVETYVDIPDFNCCRYNVGIQFEIYDSERYNVIT